MQPAEIVVAINTLLQKYGPAENRLKQINVNHASDLKRTGELVFELLASRSSSQGKPIDLFLSQLEAILQHTRDLDEAKLHPFIPKVEKIEDNMTIELLCCQAIHIAWMVNEVDKTPLNDLVSFRSTWLPYVIHREKYQSPYVNQVTWLFWEYALLSALNKNEYSLLLAIHYGQRDTLSTLLSKSSFDFNQPIRGITARNYALSAHQYESVTLIDSANAYVSSEKIADEIIAIAQTFPDTYQSLVWSNKTKPDLIEIIRFIKMNNLLHTARLQKIYINENPEKEPDYPLSHTQKHLEEHIALLKKREYAEIQSQTELENLLEMLSRNLGKIEMNLATKKTFFIKDSAEISSMDLPLLLLQTLYMALNMSSFSVEPHIHASTFISLYNNTVRRMSIRKISVKDWNHWKLKLCIALEYINPDPITIENDEPATQSSLSSQSTLLWRMVKAKNQDAVSTLLRLGMAASLEVPLHLAVRIEQISLEIIQILLQHGADVHEQDGHGCNALYLSNRAKRNDIVALLLDNHATPSKGDITRVSFSSGWTFLHEAVIANNHDLVKAILDASDKHGIDTINRLSHNQNKCTALHLALTLTHCDIAITLLKHPKADKSIKDAYGQTAEELARSANDQRMIAFLSASAKDAKNIEPQPIRTSASLRK